MGASKVCSSSSAAGLLALAVGLAAVASSSEAYVFYPGGRDGWVVDPAESYNHWAERNRFQVDDTIVFTHEEGADPVVLLVSEEDYDACNTRSPVQRLEAGPGGSSVFRFDRSGPFFFISGDEDRCQKGQKLYVVVMAVRPARPPAAAAPAPDDADSPTEPPASAPAPGVSALGDSGDASGRLLGAPPPTAGASRMVEEAIVGPVAGILAALLVLCVL